MGLAAAHAAGVLLGIDIGTYESKGALVTPAGEVVAFASRPHELSVPRPGWAEHDADAVWWQEAVSICRELLLESDVAPECVSAVCCSGIAPCMLPVDHAGRPLRTAILYGADTRATAEIGELNEDLGADAIFQHSGKHLSSQSLGPKIRWFARHDPELFEKTAKILTASSYLVYKLTGEAVVDYYTAAASFEPMFDLEHLQWSSRFADSIISRDRLPSLAWSAEVVGYVSGSAARETGLKKGTPVVAGSADAASEALSVGAIRPRDLMVMYGSTTFFIETLERLVTAPELWGSVFLEPGTYALAAGMSTTGSITRWLRDSCARDLTGEEFGSDASAYAVLASEAAQVRPGSDGLVVLPYFSGERTPISDPLARGVVAGLTLYHGRGHLYRGILEGVAYGVRHHIDVMDEHGVAPLRIVAAGGGTKNPLWLQIVSDVTGLVQHVPRQQIGAAYGDAFLAGIGAGIFDRIEDVHQWVTPEREIEPDPDHKGLYDELYAIYRRLYESTGDEIHQLARLGAAGSTSR